MKRIERTCFASALTAAALAMTIAPVLGQGSYVDPFAMNNRAPGKNVARDGDVSVGATMRTDESYSKGGLFSGPRVCIA